MAPRETLGTAVILISESFLAFVTTAIPLAKQCLAIMTIKKLLVEDPTTPSCSDS